MFKNRHRDNLRFVSTIELRDNIKKIAHERNDNVSVKLLGRMEGLNDLVAEEAVYHSHCYIKFKRIGENESKVGRPEEAESIAAFEATCQWLENTTNIYTFDEIYCKMSELSKPGCCYSKKSLRNKLSQKYGKNVYFANEQNEKSIVKAAAKILIEKMRNMNYSKEEYPTLKEDISIEDNNWVPDLLNLFMSLIVPNKLKRTSLSQCIVQTSERNCAYPFTHRCVFR